jgi:hypothetical protein
VNGGFNAPAALRPGKNPGDYCVGPTAGQNVLEKTNFVPLTQCEAKKVTDPAAIPTT